MQFFIWLGLININLSLFMRSQTIIKKYSHTLIILKIEAYNRTKENTHYLWKLDSNKTLRMNCKIIM